jgi:SAM-dependent methyltransferase
MDMQASHYEALNIEQVVSETDPFTEDRYRQFFRSMDPGAVTVLDIGCNTGRGGAVLKQLKPALQIAGLDIVQDRLDRLPGGVY